MGIIKGQALSELHAVHEMLEQICADGALASRHALRAVQRVERYLARPVRIAVLGEENSGKSLFLNYLLKHQILPTSRFSPDDTEILIRYAPEPNTYAVSREGHRARLTSRAFGALSKADARPKPRASNIIYHSSDPGHAVYAGAKTATMFASPKAATPPSRLIEVGLPIELLKQVELIEVRNIPSSVSITPASLAFRQVDIAVWCTLATQAWKETEAMSWRRIPAVRRQSALMLVTYKDAISDCEDEIKIQKRLCRATSGMFDDIQLVSLKDAIASLLVSEEEDMRRRLKDASNIGAVERSLMQMVQERKRHRMRKASKLLRISSAMLEKSKEYQVSQKQKICVISGRLNQLADMLHDTAPSALCEVEAA